VAYKVETVAASGSQEKTISNLKISDFKWRRKQKSRPRDPIGTRTVRRMPALQENDVVMSGEDRRV
jgi:hypothetical protein